MLLILSFAIPTLSPAARDGLRASVKKLLDASTKKDAAGMVAMMYPPVVKAMGGADGARKIVASTIADADEAGTVLVSAKVDDPHACVRAKGGELQCVMKQRTVFENGGEKIQIICDTLAFSSDDGKSWTFFSLSMKDVSKFQARYPDLPLVPQAEPTPVP